MNRNKLLDAIGEIGDDLIIEAKNVKKSNKNKVIKMWISAVAAILVIAFVGGSIINPIFFKVSAISEASYPECVQYPDESLSEGEYKKALALWEEDQKNKKASFDGDFENLKEFFTKSAKEFVAGSDVDNTVISPLSMYMSLGVIAEVTEENSRQQILDLLNLDSIDELRQQQQFLSIFNYHYSNDGKVRNVVSNSLWLNNNLEYNQSALDDLAEIYYVSSYYGKMGGENYNKKLREWINKQTNDYLKDRNGNLEMPEGTVLNLATTISFGADWLDMFLPEDGYEGVFYTKDETKTTSYCRQVLNRDYYTTDSFSAVKQEMTGGYGMWFILPDDTEAENLLNDESTMKFIMTNGETGKAKEYIVDFSLPVFDAYSEIDLSNGYKNMGLTNIFNSNTADFSPIIENDDVEMSSLQHNVRLKIEDNAETSDDYTVVTDSDSIPDNLEKVEFTLNKPFIFALTSDVGIPLFVGIVNQPS